MSNKTNTALKLQINTDLADNTSGDIDEADVRGILTDIVDTAVPTRVAVIGDSLSTQNFAIDEAWPDKLQTLLQQNGVGAEVRSFSTPGHSFDTAMNLVTNGSKTSLDMVIEYAPDVVIVALGVNDTVSLQGSAVVSEKQNDALTFFGLLRAALPATRVYYAREVAFDEDNFPAAANLKNKAIPQGWRNQLTTGPLAYKFSEEILEDAVSPGMLSAYSHWVQLDAYINAIKDIAAYKIDGIFNLNLFKIGRLGLFAPGGIHLNHAGNQLIATNVLEGLLSVNAPLVEEIRNTNTNWSSVEDIFTAILTPSGDGYVTNTGWTDNDFGLPIAALGGFSPASWFLPYRSSAEVYPTVLTGTGAYTDYFHVNIRGSKPHSQLMASVNGGDLFPYSRSDGEAVFTDEHGSLTDVNTNAHFSLPAGSWSWRFSVGDIIYPPVTITQG